jgi:predicted 3-demethylubiquinone-9 3-methyltransferase (glyoxalase superfamily)
VMTVAFQLEGEELIALNGGPDHTFTDAISFVVNCEGQDEVDHFWKLLSDGGEEGPCGWLKDRYGLSWQVIPTALPKLLQDTDPARAQAVMQAMLQMKKIDIAELERAAQAA